MARTSTSNLAFNISPALQKGVTKRGKTLTEVSSDQAALLAQTRDQMLENISGGLQRRMQAKKKRVKPDYGLKELDSESFKNKYLDNSPRADYIDGLRQKKLAEDNRRARTNKGRRVWAATKKLGATIKTKAQTDKSTLNSDIITTPKSKAKEKPQNAGGDNSDRSSESVGKKKEGARLDVTRALATTDHEGRPMRVQVRPTVKRGANSEHIMRLMYGVPDEVEVLKPEDLKQPDSEASDDEEHAASQVHSSKPEPKKSARQEGAGSKENTAATAESRRVMDPKKKDATTKLGGKVTASVLPFKRGDKAAPLSTSARIMQAKQVSMAREAATLKQAQDELDEVTNKLIYTNLTAETENAQQDIKEAAMGVRITFKKTSGGLSRRSLGTERIVEGEKYVKTRQMSLSEFQHRKQA